MSPDRPRGQGQGICDNPTRILAGGRTRTDFKFLHALIPNVLANMSQKGDADNATDAISKSVPRRFPRFE